MPLGSRSRPEGVLAANLYGVVRDVGERWRGVVTSLRDSRENRIVPATILIVDDDQTLRELLQLHLRNAGYAVHVAEDAVEAGHLILRQPPDLIISDVNMPHMDGFEFIAALKADKSLPYIPVIFLTSMEEGDQRGKELGAVGYITKPVRADRLLSLVAKHVPGGTHPIG